MFWKVDTMSKELKAFNPDGVSICVKSIMKLHECFGCLYFGKCSDVNREMKHYGNNPVNRGNNERTN